MLETLILAAALQTALPAAQALPQTTVRAPKAVLHLQVASTEAQRERGLMSVRVLRAHTGMLFVFDSDAPVAFWMKDTLVPLDMVFIGADGSVRRVFANVAPAPLSMPDSQIPREQAQAKYVIELPAGEAARDGLTTGVRLAIDARAP